MACSSAWLSATSKIFHQLQARLVQPGCQHPAAQPHSSAEAACKHMAEPATPCRQWCMGWPANFAATNPHLPVVAVVGDHPEAQLREAGSGQVLSQLVGHADFSFAAAWHPAGHLLATGNQVGPARTQTDSCVGNWFYAAGPVPVWGQTLLHGESVHLSVAQAQ